MSKPVLLLLLLWPVTAFGQSIIIISPQQCVWRAGDNPAWAASTLDETGWQPSTQWKLPVAGAAPVGALPCGFGRAARHGASRNTNQP